MISTGFLAQKTIGKKNIFSSFWFQEMSLKGGIFVNFLPQKFITKYVIVSTYCIFCNFCVSENFDMSPVGVCVCWPEQRTVTTERNVYYDMTSASVSRLNVKSHSVFHFRTNSESSDTSSISYPLSV